MNRLAAFVAAFLLAISPAIAGDLPRPLTDDDFRAYPEAQVKLGQLLFYDRILSGTYRVSCATCHNHDRASSNGERLDGKEEERDDLAVNGEPVYEPFKPSSRHAPPLFNLGAKQFTRMFSDGRVERLPDGSFRSPAGEDLPKGLNDVLAVQALFPAVQGDELAGTIENDLTVIAHKGSPAIWDALAARVRGIGEYWSHFEAAFPELKTAEDITITHIANAIGAFVGTEWRSDDAPFDRYLRGDEAALTAQQKRGMGLFYGEAHCDACHSGALQSDHEFHRIFLEWPLTSSVNVFERLILDLGRGAIAIVSKKLFSHRTPSLRNIENTPPYGRSGPFGTLEQLLKAHTTRNKDSSFLDKSPIVSGSKSMDPAEAKRQMEVMLANSDMPRSGPLADTEITDLIAFLTSLTDEKGLRGKLGKPAEVPSSLALD